MPLPLPRSLVEHVLLGPAGDRRQLQDSPILGDVWIQFAENPGEPWDLLITPHNSQSAAHVAVELDDLIAKRRTSQLSRASKAKKPKAMPSPEIAHLQGIIAARLFFEELLAVVVPLTAWWKKSSKTPEMKTYLTPKRGQERLRKVLGTVGHMLGNMNTTAARTGDEYLSAFDRYVVLAGIILWAHDQPDPKGIVTEVSVIESVKKGITAIGQRLTALFIEIVNAPPVERQPSQQPLVYQISLNRRALLALDRSVPAVKADAARHLFNVDCSDITWAVIDSGVKGDHPCFMTKDEAGKAVSRVKASFDFSNYRKIVSLDNIRIFGEGGNAAAREQRLQELIHADLKTKLSKNTLIGHLTNLANDLKLKRPIHWEFVEPFVEIKIDGWPAVSDHGTHVAGIIGASKGDDPKAAKTEDAVDGMCPNIRLYDFRVIARDERDTEFSIIAVLQYIRHINERHDYITIHGANLSLSIKHDVRNYACGRTPICVESERLVDSGVVVVAAAGNFGYQSFTTKDGSFDSYAAFSITDPGNADGVITVGSTHRYSPHTYGISFFSSRGPTGDGRVKPDLVAPGERIRAPFREGWGDLDGTSMAAPHVSGAAAMLMARYSELIGQPRRIKRILCETATDLGREKTFQGHGMLDVLRAFQSI